MAGTGLIVQVLIDKFWDHLPLYRQQQRFKREGIDIAASTIDHWVKLGMQRLELLYEYQKGLVLHSPYLQVDETVIKVLDHQNKSGKTHQGYFWAYHDPLGKQTFFKYEPTRAGAYPSAMLKDFTGYLQTDGYGGYGAIAQKENIVHLACWAHTRRKFEEALSHDKVMAETAMVLIQELYAVERLARDQNRSGGGLDADQIKELRLENPCPNTTYWANGLAAICPRYCRKARLALPSGMLLKGGMSLATTCMTAGFKSITTGWKMRSGLSRSVVKIFCSLVAMKVPSGQLSCTPSPTNVNAIIRILTNG